jgi:hypothetical protein
LKSDEPVERMAHCFHPHQHRFPWNCRGCHLQIGSDAHLPGYRVDGWHDCVHGDLQVHQ